MDELMDELPSHLFKQLIPLTDIERVPTAVRRRVLDNLMSGLDELEREEAEAERVQRKVERAVRNYRVDADGCRYPGGLDLLNTDDVHELRRIGGALLSIAHSHRRQHDGKGASRRRGQQLPDIETLEVYREQLRQFGKVDLAVEQTAKELGIGKSTVYRRLRRQNAMSALAE